jgi:TPP-dependent pyruvate/acetoin dehydrogenase alpha subunit
MSELNLAPNGAAAPAPPATSAPVRVPPPHAPLISPDQLQRLYDLILQYQLADAALRRAFSSGKWPLRNLPALQHPAVCAGLFAHLREGDGVGDANYAFAANVAAGAPLARILQGVITRATKSPATKSSQRRAALAPSEQLAMVTGAALAHQAHGTGQVVIAFPAREFWQSDRSSATILRWAASQHLPILYVTFARTLPSPGKSQSAFGLPQIAVDANDVVAVYRVAQESMLRARTGVGPTWIQCVLSGDAADPLAVMQKFLKARGMFDPSRKISATKTWREEWKQSWRAAAMTREPSPPLPVVSYSAGR